MAECKAMRNIRHRNLVRVISACSSIDFQGNDFKALVYEYMTQGSLDKWLNCWSQPQSQSERSQVHNLDLLQRVNIMIDVASALEYLHDECQIPVIHCDLKPSNFLLDNDMVGHVGDFGLARRLPELKDQIRNSSFGVQGTIGYAPPEYGLGSEESTKGDIYSFGIILLEIMTGKSPTDPTFENGLDLHNYVKMALPDRLMEIVDPILVCDENGCTTINQKQKEYITLMMQTGQACSTESSRDRMDVRDIINYMKSAKEIFLNTRVRAADC